MKNIVFLFLLILNSLFAFSQISENVGKHAETIIKYMDALHYKNKSIDSVFTNKIESEFIRRMNADVYCFLSSDIEMVLEEAGSLHENIGSNSQNMIDVLVPIYKQRLTETMSLVDSLCQLHYNYKDTTEYINQLDSKGFQSLEDRADYWRRNVKYRILQEMISLVEKDDTLELTAENVLKMQEKAKDIRKHRFHRTFEKLLNNPSGLDNYLASVYLNTIANYYDPHSNYFSPTDMEQFNNSLSVNTRNYGIEFGENERGEVEVSALIPGGPAWKSGKIKEGDLLLKIVYDSVEVEISYLDIRGVNELIDQIGEKEVEFFLKQKSGEFISDRLNREEIKSEKNLVKHLILKGKKNIGYIMIPGFYMNGETPGEIGCSHDVARSVLKMQEDEVEGIILDLRFNGGGAMQEALDLSGIFIDQGPLGLYQEKNGKAHVMKDSHRGTVYNGPLIVLVNSVSASASELTAGVLQDYNRALIVGDQTYGKATAQVVYPLNSSLPIGNSNHAIDSGNGFIKITGAKFYRVSGVSHQKEGIIPDMKVCDVYSGLDYGEDNYQYALEADSSRTDVSYKKLALRNIDSLRFKSEERLKENEDYKSIQDFIAFYQERFNSTDSSYSINIHRMIRFYSEWNGIIQEVEKMGEGTSTHYTLSTISFDKEILAFDDYLKTTYEKLIEGINSDITLEEAYLIMLDFINQNQ